MQPKGGPNQRGASGVVLPYVAGALGAVLFGASVVVTRRLATDIHPFLLAALRYLPGALLLTPLLRTRPTLRDLGLMILLGGMLFALFPVTFQLSLQYTVAMHGALVLALTPITTALLSAWRLGEPLGWRRGLGFLTALCGIFLLALDSGLSFSGGMLKGDLLMLIPAVTGSIYVVFGQGLMRRYGAFGVTGASMLAGVLLLLPLLLPHAGQLVTLEPGQWGLVAFLSFPGGAIGFALWMWANARLPPGRVGVLLNLNPLTATVLGAWMLGEGLTPLAVAALLCGITGILVVTRVRAGARQVPAPAPDAQTAGA